MMSKTCPRLPRVLLLMRYTLLPLILLMLATAACGYGSRAKKDDPAATLAAVRTAHDGYVAAINANRVDSWMDALSDEVVYFVPNQKALVGKAAVGQWCTRYLREVTTHWTKPVQDFEVSGDWAFGRYEYTAADSVIIRDPETEGGGTANDTGWGLVVYHRETGQWKVARDAWGSDRPAR